MMWLLVMLRLCALGTAQAKAGGLICFIRSIAAGFIRQAAR